MSNRKTPQDYHDLAVSRGYEWLGPEVNSTEVKTGWRCTEGHIWQSRYQNIQQGNGCPYCGGNAPKTEASYQALAAELGFEWLGPKPSNVLSKTSWRCREGHVWEASYSNIKGCPHCARNIRKTPQDYHDLAKEYGLEWLGPEVTNNRTKTTWRCASGHEWQAAYSIIQKGVVCCPYCANNVTKAPTDYQLLASERGFTWLGPEVQNNHSKTSWRCPEGHTWQAPYCNIRQGRGCPHCANQHRNDSRRLKPVDYTSLANEKGWTWLGPEVTNNCTKTTWMCSAGHTLFITYEGILRLRDCPQCTGYSYSLTPDDYRHLAQVRGLIWLEAKVPSTNQIKTTWRCQQGHIWQSNYANIQQGTGCPVCKGTAPKTAGDYADLALECGLIWLGPFVRTVREQTNWQCAKGHIWEAPYTYVQSGSGCPYCQNRINGQPVSKPQLALHSMLGGELNYRVKRYAVDVALFMNGISIAVEYDCWYWHNGHEARDAKRDAYLQSCGWRILRIKSSVQLPTPEQLDAAIKRLLDGSIYEEIILPDWREPAE